MTARLSLLAVFAAAAVAAPAGAGFVATTGTDLALFPEGADPGPDIGDPFSVPPAMLGTFTAYAPDTAADPQIAAGDLANFRYGLDGTLVAFPGPGQLQIVGTYRISYQLGDVTVSAGTFDLLVSFIPGTNTANLAATLIQTEGPANPAFADLSYGGSPVLYAGFFVDTTPGVSGTVVGTLTQSAQITPVVPVPATLPAAGLVAAALAALRRRVG